MLRNNFYTLLKNESEGNTVKALISFQQQHPIFAGHFPGHPVVPGVCMMQILREVMEDQTGKKLKIVSGENLKFLSVINPEQHTDVEVNVTYSTSGEQYSVTGSIHATSVTFFKFKGTLQPI